MKHKPEDNPARHFQIGVVGVSLRTGLAGLHRRYESLYGAYRREQRPSRAIRVAVTRRRRARWHRWRFEVSVNRRTQFAPVRADELVSYVEWAVNWEVPRVMPEYLHLHASSMEVDGKGVIFPGYSGCGKTTLTAALLERGWRYLCDEFALIHTETLRLHPYPRALCIKKSAYALMKSVGLSPPQRFHDRRGSKGPVWFLNPLDVRAQAVGRECPIRYVIFPGYRAGARPALRRISRAEAAFALHHVCFNLLSCRKLGLDVLVDMIRGASCFRLTSGEIAATCDLVRHVVEGSADNADPQPSRSGNDSEARLVSPVGSAPRTAWERPSRARAGPHSGPYAVGPHSGPYAVGPHSGPYAVGPNSGPYAVGPHSGPCAVGPHSLSACVPAQAGGPHAVPAM